MGGLGPKVADMMGLRREVFAEGKSSESEMPFSRFPIVRHDAPAAWCVLARHLAGIMGPGLGTELNLITGIQRPIGRGLVCGLFLPTLSCLLRI